MYYNKAIIEFAASYDCSLFTQQQVLEMFSNVIKDLQKSFGTWKVAWGEINRLQRIHPSGYLEKFSDDNPSLPIDATDGDYGSLFAYRSRNQPGQKRRYSTFGSTFIACIEFGKRINAYTVMGFGQSADPSSKHYFDQAPLYASHQFKQAWFYKEDVLKNAEREYHPGE